MNKPLILGITGPFGSGKTTAADLFETAGFQKIILSSFLEKQLKIEGKEITRKNLQDLGNLQRVKYGAGILAKKALGFIHLNKINKAVIDGIRNIGEVEEFKKNSNFALIGILANRDVRLKRLQKLKRREKLTQQLFDRLDYRDLGVGEKETGLQVAVCLAISDYFILNNGGEEEFRQKLREVLEKL